MAAGVEAGSERTDGPRHVFLSYSRDDLKVARAVIAAIEGAGHRVWWDGLIAGGERYHETTHQALERARAVVVLWSKTSVASHWVHDEAMRGRDRGCLVPLSIDGSEPPLGFRQFQYLDVSGRALKPSSPPMRRALQAIGALLDSDAALASPPPPRAASRPGRRAVLAGAAGLATAAGGLAAWRIAGGTGAAAPNSIAVLPFDNLSGDPAKQYLADGLSAEVRAQLSRNPLFSVVGQVSSNAIRDAKGDARAIARKLGVTYLLDGNLRLGAQSARVAAELTEADSGFAKWADSFDGSPRDMLDLQEHVARSVGDALAGQFARPAAEARQRGGGSADPRAFDAYLRGRSLFESQLDEASDRAALAQFGEAVRLDPTFAAAGAARSRALAVIANQYAQSAERKALYRDAIASARAAIRSAPAFGPGYAALGYACFYGALDVQAATEPYEQAFRYGRGDPDVLSRYALFRARLRQSDQATAAIARAKALDPLNPSVFKIDGLVRFAHGDYEGAIAAARRGLAINPARATLNGDIGNALLMLGRIDAADEAFAHETSRLLVLPGGAIAALKRNDRAAAQRGLDAVVAQFGDNGYYQQAQILAQWGRGRDALDALERAHAELDSGLVSSFVDPFLAPLAGEPRFRALLRALRFV